MRKRLFPDRDHLAVAQALSNLGSILHERGQWAEAERFLQIEP